MSIGKIAEDIINKTPFIREAMADNLINISALARLILPEVEEIAGTEIKEGALIMAIKRMPPGPYFKINNKIKNFMSVLGDFIVRSDLEEFTYKNSSTFVSKNSHVMKTVTSDASIFYASCRSINETTIITNSKVSKEIINGFKEESLITHVKSLSAVTIILPPTNTEIIGIYYYILKQIAWNGINVRHMVSTSNEFTIIVDSDIIDNVFSILMKIKKGVL
jgi:hypothetical protein